MEQNYAEGKEDWKRDVHQYIDEQIDKFVDANQKEFQKLSRQINDVHNLLKEDIEGVLGASAEAHKKIISTQEEILKRLDRLESK